jgi:hypothetical protein
MKTKHYISEIKNYITNINSILEIQCGSEYGIENCEVLQDENIKYIGVDVVDKIIRDNRQYFRDKKNKIFITLDASNEPLPKSDLVICVGMAPYLPVANIWSLLENIRDSEAKYFAFDYYDSKFNELEINYEINLGNEKDSIPENRAINLCKAPFYFPRPDFSVKINDSHLVVIYEIEKVRFFMDVYSDKLSKLRRRIFDNLEEDFRYLRSIFIAESENGEELFRKMMIQFLEIDYQNHVDRYFYSEPYHLIINKDLALKRRNSFLRLVYGSDAQITSQDYEIENSSLMIEHSKILAKDYIRWKMGLSFFMN